MYGMNLPNPPKYKKSINGINSRNDEFHHIFWGICRSQSGKIADVRGLGLMKLPLHDIFLGRSTNTSFLSPVFPFNGKFAVMWGCMGKRNQKITAIMRVLKEEPGPITSQQITELLTAAGHDISERTVRLYLKEMDDEGYTAPIGRKGRVLTDKGLDLLRGEQIVHRVGYFSAKIDQMTYAMTFDLARRSGTVVVNISLVDPRIFAKYIDEICRVFSCGYAMGTRVMLASPGETVGEFVIPDDKIGFCTVCSISLNGVLLKHGIPAFSRFGGLLELNAGKAQRFVEVIHYDGTSIDPLEVFIRSGMTGYRTAIQSGNGRIGASFRDMPADSRELVTHVADRLKEVGLGGFLTIGLPGQPVLDVPVSEGRIGSVVIGGLNPIAILEEAEIRVVSKAMSGLVEYNRLYSYKELPDRLRGIPKQ